MLIPSVVLAELLYVCVVSQINGATFGEQGGDI